MYKPILKEAEPNAAHKALVELQDMGKLHTAAGTCWTLRAERVKGLGFVDDDWLYTFIYIYIDRYVVCR